jgi:hypothetical protein
MPMGNMAMPQQFQPQPSTMHNLPPGATVRNTSIYMTDARRVMYGAQNMPQQQQQQPSPPVQQQFGMQMQPQMPFYQQPAPTQAIAELQQPQQQLVPQALYIPQQSTVSAASAPSPQALSSQDGSLAMQDCFLASGTVHPETGFPNCLELKVLWVRVPSSSGDEMKLSVRMTNANQGGYWIRNVKLWFEPNSFGLTIDPSMQQSSQTLNPGQTHTANMTLYCTGDNQRTQPTNEDFCALAVGIQYDLSTAPAAPIDTLRFRHQTLIPVHLFLVDHPQSYSVSRTDVPSWTSATEDGPRMTQSSFLDQWSTTPAAHTFQLPTGISWRKWYEQYRRQGILDLSVNSQTRDVIKVFEHKMAMNRVYNVASREVPRSNGSDLVFFVSCRVGDGSFDDSKRGQLVLAELRVLMEGDSMPWDRCEVTFKGALNPRLWIAMERSITAILTS